MIKYQEEILILSLILIDSVPKKGENFYPQICLEECKCFAKEKIPGNIY